MVQIIQTKESGTGKRVMRRPQHQFQLAVRPYQIQPFLLAPVLPGETMETFQVQARTVTDPLANPLVGWWHEMYFFYVKHTDMVARDNLMDMMLDPEYDISGSYEAIDTQYYNYEQSLPWAKWCERRVVEEYFRNEGEAWSTFHIDSVPIAAINSESWLQSVTKDDIYKVNDADVDLNADSTIMTSEVEKAMRMWNFQVQNNLTDMTYNDFLRTYGVKVPQAEQEYKPELIRYIRDWTYPTNTVEASTGVPASACSWAIQERADKRRYFKEPGFIFGVQVIRPKVYFENQTGSAAGLMQDAMSWLPAMLSSDPRTSLVQVPQGDGPLPNFADVDGYWVDVKDLLLYGDQFINYNPATVARAMVDLPSTTLERRYCSEADVDGLFAGASVQIRTDGIVSLGIRGTQIDTTPGPPTEP